MFDSYSFSNQGLGIMFEQMYTSIHKNINRQGIRKLTKWTARDAAREIYGVIDV